MAGRRSERSRKSVEYSTLSATSGNKIDKDSDDDDFADPTPPRKKTKKPGKKKKHQNKKEDEKPVAERKSRNRRLSEEEKYQQELEAALKMSMTTTSSTTEDAESENKAVLETSESATESQDISVTSEPPKSMEPTNDKLNSCIVQADVLASPNTKMVQNKSKAQIELRNEAIVNEAALVKEDSIIVDPVENNKETGRRKSGRSRKDILKKQLEEEYEMSESEDESSSEEEISDESDYQETPKKKDKSKKHTIKKETNKNITKKGKTSKNSDLKLAMMNSDTLVNKENKAPSFKSTITTSLEPTQSLKKPTLPALPRTPKPTLPALPRTPKTSSNLLMRRSPALTKEPGKFIQPGWTPPGPAGSKSTILKSSQSPSVLRVGLSRNVRLPPLHPKVDVK